MNYKLAINATIYITGWLERRYRYYFSAASTGNELYGPILNKSIKSEFFTVVFKPYNPIHNIIKNVKVYDRFIA